MIEGFAAMVAGVFTNPITSTLVGFLPDVVGMIGNARYHFIKSRRLDALVKEYSYIAMAMGCPSLAKLLGLPSVIDELDASCNGSMSKEAIAEQLLSNASIPENEPATQSICLQFVSDYFDAKNWIGDEKTESAAAKVGEQVVSGVEVLSDKIDRISGDIAARDKTTPLLLRQVVSGALTHEDARQHLYKHGRDGLAERMLGLYCDVLEGNGIDSDSLSMVGSFYGFATFLAGCMVSAWRLDDLEQLAIIVGHELREDVERILPVIRCSKPLASIYGDNSLEGFHDDDFAMLCVAEYTYHVNAFDASSWYFRKCVKPLNEIAELHRRTADLLIALINTHVEVSDVKSFVDSIPSGVARSAVETAIDAANLGLGLLGSDDFEDFYASVNEDAKKVYERALGWHRLEGCTAEEAWSILRRADECRHYDVFLMASDKLINNPSESEKLRKYWKGHTNMLCDQYSLLEFYLSRVDPDISAEEAEELIADKLYDPVFNLALAEHFVDRDVHGYTRCVERAITTMKDREYGVVDIAHAHVWVPYLVEHGRTDEVFDILAPIGALPERAAADLVSLLWRNGVDQVLIEDFIDDHALLLHASQPRSFYVLASHCFYAGDYAMAIAFGTRSFDGHASTQAAQIVANAGNAEQQQVPQRIVDYLVKDDEALSLYLAAGQLRIIGQSDYADDLLVRAVLLGGEGAPQSAAALVGEWAGAPVENTHPGVIGADCAVSYIAEDGTQRFIVFHKHGDRVPNGRHVLGNATHLTTRSPEFIALEGKGLGDTRCGQLGKIKVDGIETCEAHVLRLCFRLMTELTDVTVLELGDDPIEAMSSYLQEREDKTRPIVELVTNGLTIEGVEGEPTIHPGISTGSTLLGHSHLEFAFVAMKDPRLALRRPLENQIVSCEPGGFLLSISTLIVVAISDLGRECEELLWRSCMVTETTKNLLMREAELFRAQINRMVGTSQLDANGMPVIVPMQREERQSRRDFAARVTEILNCVQIYNSDADNQLANFAHRNRPVEVGINELHDWDVCRRDGLTYVTEDAMEAILAAGDETMTWCNLLQALAMLGVDELQLSQCSLRMHRAGCIPSMGRSQALYAYELLGRATSLAEEELATLLNYLEAIGYLDSLESASQEDAEEEDK